MVLAVGISIGANHQAANITTQFFCLGIKEQGMSVVIGTSYLHMYLKNLTALPVSLYNAPY
jgi:hypothetical protein